MNGPACIQWNSEKAASGLDFKLDTAAHQGHLWEVTESLTISSFASSEQEQLDLLLRRNAHPTLPLRWCQSLCYGVPLWLRVSLGWFNSSSFNGYICHWPMLTWVVLLCLGPGRSWNEYKWVGASAAEDEASRRGQLPLLWLYWCTKLKTPCLPQLRPSWACRDGHDCGWAVIFPSL